ncbi:hypothetical protein QZ287_14630 [Brevibacillus laterosporus]|nr:hypothetical protein [Brevibacillus laterosporus]MDO0942294.1 hypothetical protein [Brevibacillus laterosporus]
MISLNPLHTMGQLIEEADLCNTIFSTLQEEGPDKRKWFRDMW